LVPLFEPVFLAVPTLECDDSLVAAAVPEIHKPVIRVKVQAGFVDKPLKRM
jgi:hypothetical protein